MKMITFNSFINSSKKYLIGNTLNGFETIETNSNILISAPHGVSQVRLGKPKYKEPGSLRLALTLQNQLNTNLIAKTKNLFDDANYDLDCPYRQEIDKIIKEKKIKVLLDIHGLAKNRPCDINLGQNIKKNIKLFDAIQSKLESNGFVISIDQPFSASMPTISADMAKRHGIFTLQIEVNCAITNENQNIEKLNKLIICLTEIFKEKL